MSRNVPGFQDNPFRINGPRATSTESTNNRKYFRFNEVHKKSFRINEVAPDTQRKINGINHLRKNAQIRVKRGRGVGGQAGSKKGTES